jgi:xylitol oxidase
MTVERNWAGNVTYRAAAIRHPRSVDELCAQVAAASVAGQEVRALGSRHSFSRVADTEGVLISTTDLNRVVAIDPDATTVTVEAGIRYGDLCPVLHDAGFALANLPSLPHVTVGGAVATGTHGSGLAQPCLAAAVTGLDVVGPDGDVRSVTRADDPDVFPGYVVSVGRLGVVATLTLAIEPTYAMTQAVFVDLPMTTGIDDLDAVMGSADSVSLFTDWQSDVFHQVWCKKRVGSTSAQADARPWPGATPATRPVHMVEAVAPDSCTAQLGVPGPWHERLPHFRPGSTPSVGAELQTEYFVARSDGPAALEAVRSVRRELTPLLQVSEVRVVAADDLWLSGAYGRDSIAIHFTWVLDEPAVMAMLPRLEAALAPFEPRPHWGKLTAMSPGAIRARYPRFDDVVALGPAGS